MPVEAPTQLPSEFRTGRLARRLVQTALLLLVLVLVAVLAPGLGEVRDRLRDAAPGWLVLAVVFEVLSCTSYLLMFRPVFCPQTGWRQTWRIAGSELGVGSLVPASGIAGLALGAWALRQGGMEPGRIARRSVAFFLIKSGVNFVAVAIVGTLMALGLSSTDQPLWRTAVPAALSALLIVAVIAVARIGEGSPAPAGASRLRRGWSAVRRALVGGVAESIVVVRRADPALIAGAVGYWAWDNAVLWATFHAVGYTPPLDVVLMGYLIGQLGGLLPIPGGIGGIDGGLIGTFVVYGAPAAETTAAVLAYRVILFWVPLLLGAVSFVSLRRALRDRRLVVQNC